MGRVRAVRAPFTLRVGAHPLIARLRQHVVPPQPPQLFSIRVEGSPPNPPSRGAFLLSASPRSSAKNVRFTVKRSCRNQSSLKRLCMVYMVLEPAGQGRAGAKARQARQQAGQVGRAGQGVRARGRGFWWVGPRNRP